MALFWSEQLYIEKINKMNNTDRNWWSKKAIIFIKTCGFTYFEIFRILASQDKQSQK